MPNSRRKRVAVITGREDAHIPFVERHLRVPLLILDTRELCKGIELSYRLDGDTMVVSYSGEVLDDVAGIWYRKPQAIFLEDLPVKTTFKAYAQDALERHRKLLLAAFPAAIWASDYYAIQRANNKFLQLSTARHLGLNVADTVITSSSGVAQAFIDKHPRCISKPLTNTFPKVNGRQQIILATLIDRNHPQDLRNLYLAPTIFQEAVDVAHDVRVTIVGDKVFPAIMDSGIERRTPNTQSRDNRLGDPQIEILQNFPKNIAERCVAHNKALGLNFSAIDLILDRKGKYWFLENNPNGQWAFVEEATGQPIGRTLAALLEGSGHTP